MKERLKGPEVEGKRELEYFPTHVKKVEGLADFISKEIHYNSEVNNKLEKDANAVSATKLKNKMLLQTDLSSSEAVQFDGTENASIGVKNILPPSHGGTGKNDLKNVTVGAATLAILDSANHNIAEYFAPLESPNLKGIPQSVTFTDLDDNSDKIATTAFVAATIRRLMGATPAELDTLLELAIAVNKDPNFAMTMAKALNDLDSRIRGQSSEYENPKDNQIWFDASERKIKFYNAETGKWESFEVSSSNAPTNPVDKQIWFDVNERCIKIFNSVTNRWENFETANNSVPDNPVNNQIWTDVDDKSIKIFNSETNQWEIFVAKPVKTEITIPTSGWIFDDAETSDYKYFFEIEVENLSENDIVEIFYSRASISTFLEAGICPSDNEPMTGKFRIYSADVPTQEIFASYVVWKG